MMKVKVNNKEIGLCKSFSMDKNATYIELDEFIDKRALDMLQGYLHIMESWSDVVKEEGTIHTKVMENFILNLSIQMSEDLKELEFND